MKYKNYIFVIIFILSILFLTVVFSWREIYLPLEPNSQREIIFAIEKGQGGQEISFNLKKEGLIRSGLLFRFYTYSKGVSKKLQAGQYLLSPSMNIPEIVEKLVSGDVIKEKITVIEGWNLKDIGRYFENKGLFQAEEFFEIVGFPLIDYSEIIDLPSPIDFSQEFDFLEDKPKNLSLEGYLFPDTYYIDPVFPTAVKNASLPKLEKIVKIMLENFDKKLTPELRKEIETQGKKIFEIVTMASMLEKEVRTLEDKKLVSGILWRRLEVGMPLQVDATIAYILGGGQGWTFDKMRKIIAINRHIESPYNTYKHLGLPFGPICNPGLESIIAAIYPKESDYWFYLSTPEGETIFSKTLKEHNIAKAKYLR